MAQREFSPFSALHGVRIDSSLCRIKEARSSQHNLVTPVLQSPPPQSRDPTSSSRSSSPNELSHGFQRTVDISTSQFRSAYNSIRHQNISENNLPHENQERVKPSNSGRSTFGAPSLHPSQPNISKNAPTLFSQINKGPISNNSITSVPMRSISPKRVVVPNWRSPSRGTESPKLRSPKLAEETKLRMSPVPVDKKANLGQSSLGRSDFRYLERRDDFPNPNAADNFDHMRNFLPNSNIVPNLNNVPNYYLNSNIPSSNVSSEPNPDFARRDNPSPPRHQRLPDMPTLGHPTLGHHHHHYSSLRDNDGLNSHQHNHVPNKHVQDKHVPNDMQTPSDLLVRRQVPTANRPTNFDDDPKMSLNNNNESSDYWNHRRSISGWLEQLPTFDSEGAEFFRQDDLDSSLKQRNWDGLNRMQENRMGHAESDDTTRSVVTPWTARTHCDQRMEQHWDINDGISLDSLR